MTNNEQSSLFSYLCERPSRLEITITEGIAYLLKTRQWARDSILKILETHGDMGTVVDFDCESQYQFRGGPRPDLALLKMDDNSIFALLEVKIDAVLTPNQPEGYVKCLVAERKSRNTGGEVILFIVPTQRLKTVWKQVNVKLDNEYVVESISKHSIRAKNVTVSLVGWNEFLQRLEEYRNPTDREAEEIIAIMKAKTERDLIPEVPPINPTIVEDKSTALEVLHYMRLAETINKQLERQSDEAFAGLTVRTDKAALGHGYGWTGRYYYCADYEWFWVGFDPESWSDYAISPLWIVIEGSKDREVTRLKPAFAGLIDAGKAFFKTKPPVALKIPIRLKAGAGGDELVTDALEQISQVLKLIASPGYTA